MAYCDYYYYTSSFLSIRGYCKKKEELGYRDSSVSTDEERRYCEGYTSYKDCPIYNTSGSGSVCWITQAVCYYKGLSDRCGLMMSIRNFRDGVLNTTKRGKLLIIQYYNTAPVIIAAIKELPEKEQKRIYSKIFDRFIAPCMEAINSGREDEAVSLFELTMNHLIMEYVS